MKTLSMQIYELAKLNGLSTIEPEEMDICRILSIHKFNIIDLVDMEVDILSYLVFRHDKRHLCTWIASICEL
jgi:hypothetical protein